MTAPLARNRLAATALRLVFVVSAAALAAGCMEGAARQAQPKPERPVLVERVTYEPRQHERTFVATIRPRYESDLGFRVGGKVAGRLVEVGQGVTAGQPLATLDDTDLALQRDQAEAELRAARTALAQAEADFGRATNLKKQGWTTDAAMDRQRSAVAEARGRVERAEKAAALAANAAGYTVLKADADGVVTAALIERGQVVTAGQPVVRIARLEEKEAFVAVPEMLVERVRLGEASVTLWSRPDRRYVARLRELSPVADPMTRTYAARFTIAEAGEEVRLGMSATVTIAESAGDTVARVPLSALADSGKGPGLFVVDRANGTIAWKPIEVAGYEAREVLVRRGVEEGAFVVALGVQKLDPAQKVRVVESLQF